jgi:uncharacterized LabA/DUF88 family protein
MSLNKAEVENNRNLRELIDVSKPLERTMVFIDGAYLRKMCDCLFKSDSLDFTKVFWKIREAFSICFVGQFQLDLIRVYYYDAIVDKKHREFDRQEAYFSAVRKTPLFRERLGRLVGEKPFRQKGVDILMATDALTKAYRNQYDTAIFFVGDGDFIPLIEAINDAGKKTICIYGPVNTSQDLVEIFDMSMKMGQSELKDLLKSPHQQD